MGDPIAQTTEGGNMSPLAFLPLGIAIAAIVIQLSSCGTRLVDVGVPLGQLVGAVGIITGHIVVFRIKRARRNGRATARIGLAFAYLSLATVPIVGYGILIWVGGIC